LDSDIAEAEQFLWDRYNEDSAARPKINRFIQLGLVAAMGAVILSVASNQSVNMIMNIEEFGILFTKPLYFSAISGLALASVVLARVNYKARNSIIWYCVHILTNYLKKDMESLYSASPSQRMRYSEFKMRPVPFAIWQITKVVLFAPLFGSALFGMVLEYMAQGGDIGLSSAVNVFTIPFAGARMDGNIAEQYVFPAIPALTLFIPPVLAAVGLRIFVYVGISGAIRILSGYAADASENKPRFLSYISISEIITGTVALWIGFNMFFSSNVDFNTKYAIVASLAIGGMFMAFGLHDRKMSRVIIYPAKRSIYFRALTVTAVAIAALSAMTINNSIADAKKVDWIGPYKAQEIALNRYLAGLDQIQNISLGVPVSPSVTTVKSAVAQNSDILSVIRLWDRTSATAVLKAQADQDNDSISNISMLRFGGRMYWTATTVPNPSAESSQKGEWYTQHFMNTHSKRSIIMLDASNGTVIDETRFFKNTQAYYDQGASAGASSGNNYWSGFSSSTALAGNGDTYNGTGGLEVSPPISWIFDPNLIASYPDTPVHIMRFKDIHDRMSLLYPFFAYDFAYSSSQVPDQASRVEAIPVTDGTKTYWLMPLIAAFDTSRVPWGPDFTLQLVGYSLIDTYNGNVQVLVLGNDYFSNMFFEEYKDTGSVTKNIPSWLDNQIQYPREMFLWKLAKFDRYHVTDPGSFIAEDGFYDSGSDSPDYIFAKPVNFGSPAFLVLQAPVLKGSTTGSENPVGYLAIQNDLQNLGKSRFYSASGDAHLPDPASAKLAIAKDRGYASIKTSTGSEPKIGDGILYSIGNHSIYFIPLYTPEGEFNSPQKLAGVAAVGVTSSGSYYVGLGNSSSQAFQNYLLQLATSPEQGQAINNNNTAGGEGRQQNETAAANRIANLEKIFSSAGLAVVKPTLISVPVEFMEMQSVYLSDSDFAAVQADVSKFITDFSSQADGRIYEWQQDTSVDFGVIKMQNGVAEMHYISIEVGQQAN
jgi:uncharacterized membrane protein (UPF0182 family)